MDPIEITKWALAVGSMALAAFVVAFAVAGIKAFVHKSERKDQRISTRDRS